MPLGATEKAAMDATAMDLTVCWLTLNSLAQKAEEQGKMSVNHWALIERLTLQAPSEPH
jgi:hypothetical protein